MKEEEIRPKQIFDEYLRLAKVDAKSFFADSERVSEPCPACGTQGCLTFVKHGFSYEVCSNCLTLYVNPRPIASAFSKYYTESPSAKFWASTFYKETALSRRVKLWKPKALLILEILENFSLSFSNIIDIGGGFGLFAEEIRSISGISPLIIEPGPDLAFACRERSFSVVEKFLEDVQPLDLPLGPKAFVSFELFEHLHDPAHFLSHLSQLMQVNDLFIFTTLSGTGLDIQVLWEDSKSVSPPYHLNFFNPHSIRILLERLGFDVLDITTPGKLDINILLNNQDFIKDRFWRNFVSAASEESLQLCQDTISSSGWSSHMMVVCRKR